MVQGQKIKCPHCSEELVVYGLTPRDEPWLVRCSNVATKENLMTPRGTMCSDRTWGDGRPDTGKNWQHSGHCGKMFLVEVIQGKLPPQNTLRI